MPRPAVAFEAATQALKSGELIAFPTDTVYGLGADMWQQEAVARLYQAKGRSPEKAVPLLVGDAQIAIDLAGGRRDWLVRLAEACWPGPLTVVVPAHRHAPPWVRAEDGTIALRVPDHDVALGLLGYCRMPVATTSANVSGMPPLTNAQEVIDALGEWVAVLLDAPCGEQGTPSTVVSLVGDTPVILRQGPVSPEQVQRALGVG